eukprot:2950608-Rhodomonas_salina.2
MHRHTSTRHHTDRLQYRIWRSRAYRGHDALCQYWTWRSRGVGRLGLVPGMFSSRFVSATPGSSTIR